MHGASIFHKNRDGKTAFELSINQTNKDIQSLLWQHAKLEKEQCELFYELCRKGNVESVQNWLDKSSEKENTEMSNIQAFEVFMTTKD